MNLWDRFTGVFFKSDRYLARRDRRGRAVVLDRRLRAHNPASNEALGAYYRAMRALASIEASSAEKAIAELNVGERFCEAVLDPDSLQASMFISGDSSTLARVSILATRQAADEHRNRVFEDEDFVLWFLPAYQGYRLVRLMGGNVIEPSQRAERRLTEVLDAAIQMGLDNQARTPTALRKIYRAFCLSVAHGEQGEVADAFFGSRPEVTAAIFGTMPE